MPTPDNKTKKLVLSRETLAPLNADELTNVVGGNLVQVTRGKTCCVFNSCNGKGIAE